MPDDVGPLDAGRVEHGDDIAAQVRDLVRVDLGRLVRGAVPSLVGHDDLRAIERVCSQFGVRLPAAALQFVRAHPAVTLAIAGADSPIRAADTIGLAQVPIPAAFWQVLRDEGLIPAGAPVLSSETTEQLQMKAGAR